MKKRIVFSIALLMILCLTLTGCGQRANDPGVIKTDTEPSGSSTPVAPNNGSDKITDPNDPNFDPATEYADDYDPRSDMDLDTGSGPYSFEVNGIELHLNTKIDKYIKGDTFYYTDLAYDLGWHAKTPEFKERADISQFFADDDNKLYVGFANLSTFDYTAITFIHRRSAESSKAISFDRNDLNGGDAKTYYVNPGGRYTVNMYQIELITYLLENHVANDFVDPFENILARGSDARYHVYE